MNESQQKFFDWLDTCPLGVDMTELWDKRERKLDCDRFERELGYRSSGGLIVLLFAKSVWDGVQDKRLDLIDGLARVDTPNREWMQVWLSNPFYP